MNAERLRSADCDRECGLSRKAAVYALQDFGIRAVIAHSFGDIHMSNEMKNGLLSVELPEHATAALITALEAEPGRTVRIDLPRQEVTCGTFSYRFEINPFSKQCLIDGTDDIDLTLEHMDRITAYEVRRRNEAPWNFP